VEDLGVGRSAVDSPPPRLAIEGNVAGGGGGDGGGGRGSFEEWLEELEEQEAGHPRGGGEQHETPEGDDDDADEVQLVPNQQEVGMGSGMPYKFL
jgi:hypothetical protein